MRIVVAALVALAATPALAQFPPPGIFACVDAQGRTLGTLSLLVAGDYQWQPASGDGAIGQVASSGTDIEALSGPLGDAHWRGSFATAAGRTTFAFTTDSGDVTCAPR